MDPLKLWQQARQYSKRGCLDVSGGGGGGRSDARPGSLKDPVLHEHQFASDLVVLSNVMV